MNAQAQLVRRDIVAAHRRPVGRAKAAPCLALFFEKLVTTFAALAVSMHPAPAEVRHVLPRQEKAKACALRGRQPEAELLNAIKRLAECRLGGI